jgi:transposase
MENYIGLDAHSKTCTFVIVDRKGKEKRHERLKTTEAELVKFIRSVKGKKHLTFEESHLAKWLYVLFKDEVDNLVVCDPSYLTRRRGPKDDYRDTLHLAQELRGNHLTAVFHEDNIFSKLRSEVSAYQDLVRDITSMKNRYKSLFRCEAIHTKGSRIYGDETRIAELRNEEDRFVASGLFSQIKTAEEIKEGYKQRFQRYENKYSEIRALGTIPGISYTRACFIAAIVCSPYRFGNKYKFWAYSMLVKYDDKSDEKSYGKRRVPGNRVLKNVFMGAAENVILKGSALRCFYDEQREKGVDHRAAKKNLARKIAAISLAVMRNKKPFDESFLKPKKVKAKKKNKN